MDDPKPDQHPEEFARALGRMREVWATLSEPVVVVEIGVHNGGSLFAFVRLAEALGWGVFAIGIDVEPVSLMEGPRWHAEGSLIRSIRRDSYDPATVAEVRGILGNHPVDLLHVDGDHSPDGVRRDWQLWSPLLRPATGLALFHDCDRPDFGVGTLVAELAGRHRTERFSVPGSGMGSTLVWTDVP